MNRKITELNSITNLLIKEYSELRTQIDNLEKSISVLEEKYKERNKDIDDVIYKIKNAPDSETLLDEYLNGDRNGR